MAFLCGCHKHRGVGKLLILERQPGAATPLKILLMGVSFNLGNMGVSALAAGSVTCILHKFPDAEITLLGFGRDRVAQPVTVGGRKLALKSVNMRFSKKFYLPNNIAMLILIALGLKLVPSKALRKKLILQNAVLRQIEEGDLFASMSGGDSFSDIYGVQRFLMASLPQLLILLMGKRLVLLPQTLGPYKGRAVRAVAKYILNRAEIVYSRDYDGPMKLRDLLGANQSGKVRFAPDVAFVLEPRAPAATDVIGLPEHRSENRPLVGVNVSGLLLMGGYSQNNMFGLKAEYSHLVSELMEFLIEKKNADVLLIPHVFGSEGESDPPACETIYKLFRTKYPGRIGWVNGRYDQSEIKHIIGRCDFFVGSRMHACIAALSQNIPAVAIAYSDKFLGVMETVGVGALVADARKMSSEEILGVVNRAFEQRASLRSELQMKMPAVRQAVLGLFSDMPLLNGMSVRWASSLEVDREQEQSGGPGV